MAIYSDETGSPDEGDIPYRRALTPVSPVGNHLCYEKDWRRSSENDSVQQTVTIPIRGDVDATATTGQEITTQQQTSFDVKAFTEVGNTALIDGMVEQDQIED